MPLGSQSAQGKRAIMLNYVNFMLYSWTILKLVDCFRAARERRQAHG